MKFLGRQQELDQLHHNWNEVKSGRGPRFVAIVAESGYGKTRIIQEFYSRLVRDSSGPDSGGYWPATLDDEESGGRGYSLFKSNLRINPRLGDVGAIRPPIPWMWWGVRWANPGERNLTQQHGCALIDYMLSLEAHCHAAIVARLKKEVLKDSSGELGKVLWGMAPELLQLTPIIGQALGTVMTCYELGSKLFKWKKGAAQSAKDPCVALDDLEIDVCRSALGYLQTFVDPGDKDLPSVPFILILDDAQWSDPTSLQFLYQAFSSCAEKQWPLLVIATSWEKQWHEGLLLPMPEVTAIGDQKRRNEWRSLGQVVTLLSSINQWPNPQETVTVIELARLKESRELLRSEFANLGSAAEGYILAQSDGNPLFIEEFIRFLHLEARTKSWWFEARDPSRPLSEGGLRELMRQSSTIEVLMRNHLAIIFAEKPAVIELLKSASVQGPKFYGDLVVELVTRPRDLNSLITEAAARHALSLAQTPTALVAPISQRTFEFRHQAYWRQLLSMLADDERTEIERALCAVVLKWITQGRLGPDLDQSPKGGINDFSRYALRLLLGVMPDDEVALRKGVKLCLRRLMRFSEQDGFTFLNVDLSSLEQLNPKVAAFLSAYFHKKSAVSQFWHQHMEESTIIEDLTGHENSDGGISLDLSGLKSLSNEAAREIAGWPIFRELGYTLHVDMSGLSSLPADFDFSVLECVELDLSGLKELTPDQAASLAKGSHQRDFFALHLDGMEKLALGVAKELGISHFHTLTLNGVTTLPIETARLLWKPPETEQDLDAERYEFLLPSKIELKSLAIEDDGLADWIISLEMLGIKVDCKSRNHRFFVQ